MVPLQLLLAPCNRTLGGTADAAAVTSHGDGLLLLADVLEELLGAGELPAIDGLGGLAGVLERNTEVRPAGASRLRRGDLSCSVPNLNMRETAVSLSSWEPTSTCVAMRAKFPPPVVVHRQKLCKWGFGASFVFVGINFAGSTHHLVWLSMQVCRLVVRFGVGLVMVEILAPKTDFRD